VVAAIRTQSSRRGKMAFVTLDDGKDQAEIVVFNESFDAYRHLLREDALLVAEVKVMQRMERVGEEGQSPGLRIVAESLHDLAGARRKWARMLKLECNGGSSAERLLTLIEPFRSGSCPVTVHYRNASSGGEIELGDAWRVNLDDHLLHGLRDWLKPENVEIVY
jgi:DNA polymerase-3 subunit alpha